MVLPKRSNVRLKRHTLREARAEMRVVSSPNGLVPKVEQACTCQQRPISLEHGASKNVCRLTKRG